MKKLLIGVFSVLAVVSAQAADFRSQSFLNVQAITVTNLYAITNLVAFGGVGTNTAGTIFTNNNTRVVVSAAGVGAGVNCLRDVSLWARADGSLPTSWSTLDTNAAIVTELSDATISVTWSSGANSGGSSKVTYFVFTPVWDGVNADTQAGNQWTFSLAPTASQPVGSTYSTNVPMSRFPGAQKLRLLRVYTDDTDADSAEIITAIRLNGFVP